MLREKDNNTTVSDIVTFKLNSGEEIVGRLAERTASSVFISKPVQIGMQKMNADQVVLAFMPVLGSVAPDVTLEIPFSAMSVRPVKTGDDVKSNYITATSSILTPSTPSLITP